MIIGCCFVGKFFQFRGNPKIDLCGFQSLLPSFEGSLRRLEAIISFALLEADLHQAADGYRPAHAFRLLLDPGIDGGQFTRWQAKPDLWRTLALAAFIKRWSTALLFTATSFC